MNSGQVRLFIERFPTEFRLGAMAKVVLPHRQGVPFVAPGDKLPCPFLSTCNALKALEKSPDKMKAAEARAIKDMQTVFNTGVQVEWVEFEDYVDFMIYYEGVAVQGDVVVKPHILDTALMFLSFCSTKRARALHAQTMGSAGSAAADPFDDTEIFGVSAEDNVDVVHCALGDGAKVLEDAFLRAMTGKAKHRLKDAKYVLRNTETEVINFVASWRKKAHFCHANALAQQWFLSPTWSALKRVNIAGFSDSEGAVAEVSAQMAVAVIATKMVSRAEISTKSDIPRLTRTIVTMDVFRELSSVVLPAVAYFEKLQQKFLPAWYKLGAGKKLACRLLIDGESSLRNTFLAAYERTGHDVAALIFSEIDIGSDFAMVEEKLAMAMPPKPEAEMGSATQQKDRSDAQVVGGTDASVASLQEKVAQAKAAEVASTATEAAAAAARAAAETLQRAAEQAERCKKAEEAEKHATQKETRIAMDDVLTVFDNTPRSGCPPPTIIRETKTSLFIIPTQSYVRGRSNIAVPTLQTKHLDVLE